MNIVDSKNLIPLQKAQDFSGKEGLENSPQSASHPLTEAFPTLLNIPWQEAEPGTIDQSRSSVSTGVYETLQTAANDQEVKAVPGSRVSELVSAFHSEMELPGGELAKAIAHVLSMNSNLSISVGVENQSDPVLEKERLIDQYQQVSATGTLPVFSWSPQYSPSLANLDNSQASSQSLTLEASEKKPGPIHTVSIGDRRVSAQAQAVLNDQLAMNAAQTKQGASRAPMPAVHADTPDSKPVPHHVTGHAGTHPTSEKTADQFAKPRADLVSNSSQIQVASARKESHIPFLQTMMPTQLPDVISRVATGLQTTGPMVLPDEMSMQPSANKAVARIEVQLVPKNLGSVQVSVQKQDGLISVIIRTETREAEKLLSSETNSIREALKSAGLSLEEIRIQPINPSERESDVRNNRQFGQDSEYQHSSQSDRQADRQDDQGSRAEQLIREADIDRHLHETVNIKPDAQDREGLYL